MTSVDTPAGWYAPDPTRPDERLYWNGRQWALPPRIEPSGDLPADARSKRTPPTWLVSWPAIVVGLILCILPGLVLLWVRPQSSIRTKSAVTAAVLGLVVWANPTSSDIASVVSPASPTVEQPATSEPPENSSSPTPSGQPDSSAAAQKPAAGTALVAAERLQVKGRSAKTGYVRNEFGSGWVDVDRNGCDTRNDQLKAALTDKRMSGSCKVLAGTLADPYTKSSIRFEYGGAGEVDIDHVVALGDAWQKGASSWAFAKRVAFANDPINLQPTAMQANRQKGDGDAATWLPPNKSYRCTYVARQVAVKDKYGVWVTAAEQAAMIRVLRTCPELRLPGAGSQPTTASNTGSRPTPSSSPTSTPEPTRASGSSAPKSDPRYGTCAAANAAGYGPYIQGTDPEYAWYLDRDGDGHVCER